jgi:hypothetical protein
VATTRKPRSANPESKYLQSNFHRQPHTRTYTIMILFNPKYKYPPSHPQHGRDT